MFSWFTKKTISDEHKKVFIETRTLQEIVEYTRNMPILEGGLAIMIEKLVWEIELLKSKIEK